MQHRRDRRRRRRRRSSPWAAIILTVVIVLALAGMGYGVWRLTRPAQQPEGTDTTTATPTTETISATTQPQSSTAATSPTGTAQAEVTAPPQQMTQDPLNQLISVVGWALADTHPDGFHSKYLEVADMAALTEAAMTLASQGQLGIELNLTGTDDPGQVMLPEEEVNTLLSQLVAQGALNGDVSIGTLTRIGSGWAITPPEETAQLPVTHILSRETTESGELITVVLVQRTAQGDTVLQTAMVEVAPVSGGFGYQVTSWVTQDVPRYTRSDGAGVIRLSSGVSQPVLAVEITWGDTVEQATLQAGTQQVTVTGGEAGKSQVIVLEEPQQLEELTLTVEDPGAVSKIQAY